MTNVAVVRLNRNGHRFEVACYRNKIINYRQGTETDLGEVLQTDRVFVNVTRGEFANAKLLKKAFGTYRDEMEICKLILDQGDVQVTDMERNARLENVAREISGMISERCLHPNTRRPYTSSQVRDAMRSCGYMVHPTRGAKQQFLDCVKLIRSTGVLELERAKMELALILIANDDEGGDGEEDENEHVNGEYCDAGRERVGRDDADLATRRVIAIDLLTNAGIVPSDILPPPPAKGVGGGGGCDDATEHRSSSSRIVFRSDPSLYRKMDEISKMTCVGGRLEIVRQVVIEEWGNNHMTTTHTNTTILGGGRCREAEQRISREDDDNRRIRDEEGRVGTRGHDDDDHDDVNDTDDDSLMGGGGRNMISSITNLVIGGKKKNNAMSSHHKDVVDLNDVDDDDDTEYRIADPIPATNAARKKAQKAAQKKSKKARRREKEEVDERDKRIEAERVRQRERAERLGMSTATTGKRGEDSVLDANDSDAADEERVDGSRIESGMGGVKAVVQPTALRSCNTCGGAFTPGEYRLHFRSDWHGYNVKLKLRGVPPVSEREFMLCDSDVFLS